MRSVRAISSFSRPWFDNVRLFAKPKLALRSDVFCREKSTPAKQEALVKRYQELDGELLINGLRQYVSKNTKIPEFILKIEENFSEHELALSALQTAIENGDYNADVFEHEHCLRYLLYLIESDKLPYWQGMTVYLYVTALAQFTNKQRLKDSDQNFKSVNQVNVFPLIHNGQLTIHGKAYLERIIVNFYLMEISLDKNELVKFILELPPFEQNVLNISYDRNAREDDEADAVDRTIAIMVSNVLYFQDDALNYCNLPSMSMINYLHKKMSSKPLQMKPIFGGISLEELKRLHGMDQHPVAIYHPDVKSNVLDVHERRCGPFPALLHDIGHVFLANMLSEEERNILYQDLIPLIERVMSECKSEKVRDMLNEVHYRLNDYNLTHINFYKNKDRRFCSHVIRIFREELTGIFNGLRFCLDQEFTSAIMRISGCVKAMSAENNANIFWAHLNLYLETVARKLPFSSDKEEHVTRRFT